MAFLIRGQQNHVSIYIFPQAILLIYALNMVILYDKDTTPANKCTPHQGNISWQQMETTAENHNQLQCRVVGPVPVDTKHSQGPMLKRSKKDCRRLRIKELLWDGVPHECQKLQPQSLMTLTTLRRIRTITMDKPTCIARMGKAHEDSILHKEIQETKDCWEQETNLPQGIVHQLGIQNKMVTPENIHTNNIIQTEQVVFTYLEIQIHIYVYVSRNMYVYIHM